MDFDMKNKKIENTHISNKKSVITTLNNMMKRTSMYDNNNLFNT